MGGANATRSVEEVPAALSGWRPMLLNRNWQIWRDQKGHTLVTIAITRCIAGVRGLKRLPLSPVVPSGCQFLSEMIVRHPVGNTLPTRSTKKNSEKIKGWLNAPATQTN